MTLSQAIKRLTKLGFKMGSEGTTQNGGRKGAEAFNYSPHKICSEPFRDVFIGECKNGWYITSHINFNGRRKHTTSIHKATILNIFGGGKTLKDALNDFEHNFKTKTYNGYPAINREGASSKKVMWCGGTPVSVGT